LPTSSKRVAEQHLQASFPDPGSDARVLESRIALMGRLISKGESRRLDRTGDVHLVTTGGDAHHVWARVQGTTGMYQTRITMEPPGHQCTCPDWAQNGRRVGPCKHVLRLAEKWMDVLVARLEQGADDPGDGRTASAPHPPMAGECVLLDQTADRAYWKAKSGATNYWLITDHRGVIDQDAPLSGHQRGNYFRKRDGDAAWAEVKAKG
jgi:hypothetical protein